MCNFLVRERRREHEPRAEAGQMIVAVCLCVCLSVCLCLCLCLCVCRCVCLCAHLRITEVVVGAGESLVDRLRYGSRLEQRLRQPLVKLALRVARNLVAGGAMPVHHREKGLTLVLKLLDDQRVVLVRLAWPCRVVPRDRAAAVTQTQPALDRCVDVAHRLHRDLGRHHRRRHLDRGWLHAVLSARWRWPRGVLGGDAGAAPHRDAPCWW